MIKNRFVLIDTFALVHRAFHGIPPLTSPSGLLVNAVYGFSAELLSIIEKLEPEYLVAGLDLPKPTKRKEEYAEYKATRPAPPNELISQIPYIKEVLSAFNIPTIGVEGYEGEDVIATIVAQVKDYKLQIKEKKSEILNLKSEILEFIVCTGDTDTMQLVDNQTKIYLMRSSREATMYDIQKVKERYGMEPGQFVDYKALRGDPTDNIPGVPGIGEKTAAMLIQKFNSLDEIYQKIVLNSQFPVSNKLNNSQTDKLSENRELETENFDFKQLSKELDISEKVIKLLIEHKDQAYLSQKLSRIVTDAPLEFNINDAKIHEYKKEEVTKLFQELGFKSLMSRLPDVHEKKKAQQSLF